MKQDLYIKAQPSAAEAPVGATLMKTGQTTSYRTGDDGDIEAGRETSFTVLASNNPFGNTNRFTDELGGQTYTNNIVIDWSTYNGSNVLGYYRLDISGAATWNKSIDDCLAYSVGTFTSGWRLINNKEIYNIFNFLTGNNVLNYSPFNITKSNIWSSTTLTNSTASAYQFDINGNSAALSKTGGGWAFPVRTFTVTGTTLT